MLTMDWEGIGRGYSRLGFAKMGRGRGFSAANLKNFRQFYLVFHKGFREGEIPGEEICYTVCSELSWSHYRHLMRVEDPDARGGVGGIPLHQTRRGGGVPTRRAKDSVLR